MLIKYKINFYPEKRKRGGSLIINNVPLLLYFSYSGRRMVYFTGYRCDLRQWDIERQRMERNSFNKDGISSTTINDHLDDIAAAVRDIYTEQKALRRAPTTQYIRSELRKRLGEERKAPSFFEVWDEFIETESVENTWTAGTITKFKTNYKHFKLFQEKKHYKIDFEGLDETFFNKFVAFLRDDLKHRNTTIRKNLKIVKWFLRWAERKGYNKNLAYKDYDPKLKGSSRSQKIIFLSWEELMSLYSLEIENTCLSQVRDVFCFCCFSGLRYSDVYNLRRGNVKGDSIEITTIKTEDSLIIDLNQYSRAILDKYKDATFDDSKCLPVLSNQKFNDHLKDLGKLAGMTQPETVVYYIGNERKENTYQKWELLSTHCGRKTFISNAVFFNVPSEVIMSWTGHKDHKTMESYYKIMGKQKRREMDKFNNGENEQSNH